MQTKATRKSIIPFDDCQRIFKVIYGFLESNKAITNGACICFSYAGARKLKAIPVAAAAAIFRRRQHG
jgi:hypothetical protein